MSDARKPWTIKGMPTTATGRAVRAAEANDQYVWEWLTAAIHAHADRQASNTLIPPMPPEPASPPVILTLDVPGLAAAIQATVAAHQAAGTQPPESLALDTTRTLRAYMRALRRRPRPAPRLVNYAVDDLPLVHIYTSADVVPQLDDSDPTPPAEPAED